MTSSDEDDIIDADFIDFLRCGTTTARASKGAAQNARTLTLSDTSHSPPPGAVVAHSAEEFSSPKSEAFSGRSNGRAHSPLPKDLIPDGINLEPGSDDGSYGSDERERGQIWQWFLGFHHNNSGIHEIEI